MRKLTGLCCAAVVLMAVMSLMLFGCTRAKPEVPTPTAAVSSANPTATALAASTAVLTQVPAATSPLTPGPTTISVADETPTASMPATYPTAAAPTVVPGQMQHTVGWGDTLFSLAQTYGTTVEAIVAANGLWDANVIQVGQVLVIPGMTVPPVSSGQEYVVQSGDTLFSIARRFGTSVNAISLANGIVNPALIQAGQILVIPGAGSTGSPVSDGTSYTVQPGDTLSAIAARFGLTTWDIVVANNLPDPHTIFVGQTLIIP